MRERGACPHRGVAASEQGRAGHTGRLGEGTGKAGERGGPANLQAANLKRRYIIIRPVPGRGSPASGGQCAKY